MTAVSTSVAAGALVWLAIIGSKTPQARHLPPIVPAKRTKQAPPKPFGLEGLNVIGNATAPIALVEYADFECPYCRKFEQSTMPSLRREYIQPGTLVFVFRNLPLRDAHPHAQAAAVAAECAGRQGAFWPIYDRLFDVTLEDPAIANRLAVDLKLNETAFEACETGAPPRALAADEASAHDLGFSGTPTFLVGTVTNGVVTPSDVIIGAKPFGDFSAKIDQLLKRRGSS